MSIDSKIISVLNQINDEVMSSGSYNNRGVWAKSVDYKVGDVVTVCYSYWVCTAAHTSASPLDVSKWEHLGVYTLASTIDPSLVGVISTKPS